MAFNPEAGMQAPTPDDLKYEDILTIARAVAVGQNEGGEVEDALAAYYGSIPDEYFNVLKMPNVESAIRTVISQYVKGKEDGLTKEDAVAIDEQIKARLSSLASARSKAA